MIFHIKQFILDRFRGVPLGASRSPQWERVRKEWLKTHPTCAVTGDTKNCEVHHIVPFHENESLELDPNNFITLRRDMHLLFGHLLNWSSFNRTVREDSAEWSNKIQTRLL